MRLALSPKLGEYQPNCAKPGQNPALKDLRFAAQGGRSPMMSFLRYLLIALTLAALVIIGVMLYIHGSPSWGVELLSLAAITGGLILNVAYLFLNRPAHREVSTQPATGAVNVKALAYIGAACVIAWFAVDIGVKIHEEHRLTTQPSSSGYYRR
jgi:hypothetical protein